MLGIDRLTACDDGTTTEEPDPWPPLAAPPDVPAAPPEADPAEPGRVAAFDPPAEADADGVAPPDTVLAPLEGPPLDDESSDAELLDAELFDGVLDDGFDVLFALPVETGASDVVAL